MTHIRRISTLATIAVVAMASLAGPAAAKQPRGGEFTYFAVIDCGKGPMDVGSGDDLWSPLVDLETGKKHKPLVWDVSGDGFVVNESKKDGEPKRNWVVCSYTDGVATGTVTVKKA